jgi:phospholipase/carboxylesterase
MSEKTLDGPRQEPKSGKPASSLVVLLHGWGADGNDLIGLAPLLGQVLPDTAFVSPHAPEPCEMSPMGRQWFSLMDRTPQQMEAGAAAVAPLVDALIDQEMERYGLTPDRVALVGFSQGTMMSLYVAPRRAEALACVIGYSGALVGPESLAQDIKSRPPVLLVHGEEDPVVPAAAMTAAAQALLSLEFEVYTDLRPGLAHSIDEEGLKLGCAFLHRRLVGKHPLADS